MKGKIFAFTDGIYRLRVSVDEAEKIFEDDESLRAQKFTEGTEIFDAWKTQARESLLNINDDAIPKILIHELGESILRLYDSALILDKFSVFDCLMNYWNETLQDDVYMIRAYGYEAGRMIDVKKDSKGKITSWDGELIPRGIIEREYFSPVLDEIESLADEIAGLNAEIEDMREESKDENGEIPSDALDKISRKEDDARKLSRKAKTLRKNLDEAVMKQYGDLSVDEIKHLLFDSKWAARLSGDIHGEIDGVMNECLSRLVMIAERYGRTLAEIENDTDYSREAVHNALRGDGLRMVMYPGDWEVKKLGECGKFVSGNGFPLMYQGQRKGTYPFYKVSDLSNEGNENYMFRANNYISDDVAKKLSCNIVPADSVIFAKIGAAIFLERKRITTCDCCIDNNMMSFQPSKNISSRFICYVMQRLNFGDYVQTTALPSLSGKILGDISIPLPTLKEQTAIAETLAAFDTHITNLTELITKKKAIRDGALDGVCQVNCV